MTEVRRHFAVEKLDAEARAAVDEALAKGAGYGEIRRMLIDEHDEEIAVSSIARYSAGVFVPQRERLRNASVQAKALADALRDTPIGDDQELLIQKLIQVGIVMNEQEFHEVDPILLLREQREREKLALERRRLDLEAEKIRLGYKELETRVQLAEKALERVREKAAKVAGELEGAAREGRSFTPAELDRIAEEIYGVKRSATVAKTAEASS